MHIGPNINEIAPAPKLSDSSLFGLSFMPGSTFLVWAFACADGSANKCGDDIKAAIDSYQCAQL